FVGDGVNGMGVYRFLYTEPKPESATPPTIDIIIPTPQTPNPKPQKPIKPGQANAGGQVITLSSGQKITLPADKPVETTPAPGVKTLPNTGDATSVLSLIGIGLAGLAGLAAKRRED
ncbi:TPA: LPXTG cell wall anchor domain-containing protein, partial [Streptococcus suis]